jgi:hypothetical protein
MLSYTIIGMFAEWAEGITGFKYELGDGDKTLVELETSADTEGIHTFIFRV